MTSNWLQHQAHLKYPWSVRREGWLLIIANDCVYNKMWETQKRNNHRRAVLNKGNKSKVCLFTQVLIKVHNKEFFRDFDRLIQGRCECMWVAEFVMCWQHDCNNWLTVELYVFTCPVNYFFLSNGWNWIMVMTIVTKIIIILLLLIIIIIIE